MEKFCYLGDMISCYGGASEAESAKIGSAWKKFSGPVLLYYCETWQLTVADKVRLRGLNCHMIRTMCGVRLAYRVSTDILHDRVSIVVQIENMIIQSRLQWCMIMSCMEISVSKYMRLWKLK